MNIRFFNRALWLTLFCFSTLVRLAAQELIVNGSFEDTAGTFVNNPAGFMALPVGATNIPGWTITTAPLAWGTNDSFGLRTPDGGFFLDLTGYDDSPPHGGLTHTIATSPNQDYRLAFSVGAYQSFAPYSGPMTVSAIAGSVSNSFTFAPTGTSNQWGAFTLNFTAGSNFTPVTLIGIATVGGQYLGLDNVSVIGGLRISAVEKLGGDLRLSFASVAEQSYAVQSRADLVSGAWTTLSGTTNPGTGGTLPVTLTNATSEPRQFYRVVQLP